MVIKLRFTSFMSILGMLLTLTLLASPIARAEENPFSTPDSATDITVAGEDSKKAKCGEGKCGEGKCADSEKKAKCEKCAKGEKCEKCAKKAKSSEGKCSDGKKKSKCGEGKCGG